MAMIRKAMIASALTAAAMTVSAPAQASVQFTAIGGIVNQLHNNSTFQSNSLTFSICQNGSCQTMFTGLGGLHNFNDLGGINAWAGTDSFAGSGGYFDNYKFTYSGAAGYFGNKVTEAPLNATGAIPEPATWAMMIVGFGIIGMAMRRRPVVINFG